MKVSDKTSGARTAPGVSASAPAASAQAASTPAVSAAPTIQGDALSVSSGAQFIAVAMAELDKIPDIRTDKVEAIKAQMDSDAYHPDGDAVADSLVQEYTPLANADGVS